MIVPRTDDLDSRDAGRPAHEAPAMSAQHVRKAIDRWQQARPVTAVPCAVAKKFTDDGASRLAALIAYWSFFSIFPLLLAFASILGFLLEGNTDFQKDVLDSTVAQVPVIGDQLSRDVTSLKGSGAALAIGIAGAVWAGLGVTLAMARALDTLWGVRRLDRPDYVHARLRGLAILVVLGTAQIVTTVVVTLARNGTIQPPIAGIAGFAGSAAIDLLVFVTAFRVLTAAGVSTRQVLPGALVATISWLGLQTLGGLYVERVVARSSATYGVFAVVIGLLSWLWLAAQLSLVAGEVNVVLAQRLWPRSLFGGLAAADERAMRTAAEAEQRDRRQHIVVSFDSAAEPPAQARTER
jgi:YihY family inner membrane protein